MGAQCQHEPLLPPEAENHAYRKALFFALLLNATMAIIEISGGLKGESTALLADAMDFVADSFNYGITIFLLNKSSHYRSWFALLKALTMGGFSLWILYRLIHQIFFYPIMPSHYLMTNIGLMALAANLLSAWLLFRFRSGDSNRLSVWICTRNDAIGNIAVIIAGALVWGLETPWPDIMVAMFMALLALRGGCHIAKQAMKELFS